MKKKKSGGRASISMVAEALTALFSNNPEKTFSMKQIFKLLHLDNHPKKMLAISVLEEMEWDDYLSRIGDNNFKLNMKSQVQTGTFIRKGNGINSFQPDEGGKPVLVAERNSMFALDGDKVKVSFLARRRNHAKEAIVTEILERARKQFVGRLNVSKEVSFLTLDNDTLGQDIIIPRAKLKKGKTGDKAVVRIIAWPDEEHRAIIGEVIDILGRQGENDAEMHSILVQYNLPYKYPEAVERAANDIPDIIPEEEIARREDFRSVPTFTIDPHDAKDFDDALSIRQMKDNLWEVGVHIADVSHYVTEGSVIDREAQRRATSVYLVDRTIPMLPERLCNYICSLRPNEDKLAYSCIFLLNDKAEVKDFRLTHTVIRSDRRYAYEEVQDIIVQSAECRVQSAESGCAEELCTLHSALCTLHTLAQQLRERRFKNGSVKFDREELRFDTDEKGRPTRCYFKKSLEANQLIEEFMLLANRSVAEMVGKPADAKQEKKQDKSRAKKTLPYRVHDAPDPVKLETLRSLVAPLGYKLKSDGTKGQSARTLNKLMDDVSGRPEQKLVETLALRAMMKAKYSVHNIGHYGLAFEHYTHFTSPIRRYPDLMVHRLMTRYQDGARSANAAKYEELCEHSSAMEQTAAMAERESIKYKMVEFMAQHLGEEYDAHISGMNSRGIYCEIDENHCEGLILVHDLDDDYYEFDEKRYRMTGRRRHRSFQLGDPIRIKVARADVDRRRLDFVRAEE